MAKAEPKLDNAYLTPTELSALIRVSANTLKQWRSARKGPGYIKFGYGRGAAIRYPEREVFGWLENQKAAMANGR